MIRSLAVAIALAPLAAFAAAPAPPPGINCPDAEYRQFDFMVGNWTVTQTGKDQVVAKSEWKKLSPCAILEHWMPKSGYDGYSLNYYDQADKKWHQSWVDATGDAVAYIGDWRGGKMEFTADDVVTPQMQAAKLTMTFRSRRRTRAAVGHAIDGRWQNLRSFVRSHLFAREVTRMFLREAHH